MSSNEALRCVVIDEATGKVVNVILADPAVDPTPAGCVLHAVPDTSAVGIGWVFDKLSDSFEQPKPDDPDGVALVEDLVPYEEVKMVNLAVAELKAVKALKVVEEMKAVEEMQAVDAAVSEVL